ncbi:MAG TPA: hypothetical protein PLA71_00790 [Saccharofermentans sp.]|nr:hypothetical protein [Saccharofermentans sp.]
MDSRIKDMLLEHLMTRISKNDYILDKEISNNTDYAGPRKEKLEKRIHERRLENERLEEILTYVKENC